MALNCLLLGTALLGFCALQRRDLVQHYTRLFREGGFAELLVPACLRLLPRDVAAFALDATGRCAAPAARRLFEEAPAAEAGAGALACRALFLCLAGPAGGAARAWWGAAAPRAARALERLARAYVAPALVRRQLQRVKERGAELGRARVAVHWAASEVECAFAVEERTVTLRVALGAAHPLSPPRVEAPPTGAGAPSPGGAWLAAYLAHQNGSLLHALRMWMTALHARVDASPQCYICYCRLHPSTGRLPLVPCRQCRNRFHRECLVSPAAPARALPRPPAPADRPSLPSLRSASGSRPAASPTARCAARPSSVRRARGAGGRGRAAPLRVRRGDDVGSDLVYTDF